MSTTVKTSMSIQNNLWELLKGYTNKSQVMNEALKLYFDQEQFLGRAKDAYWDKIHKSLESGDGEYVLLAKEGEELTEELLEERLWS